MKFILLLLLVISPDVLAISVFSAPPLGWNSWNHYKKNITEAEVSTTIDLLVSQGFKDAGYRYVVVDGGWRAKTLDAKGFIPADPDKFPSGIPALVSKAHQAGLKFGLHTVPGISDCGGNSVGGLGREQQHVQQFVDWQLDYIKLDCCGCERPANHKGFDSPAEQFHYWSGLVADSGRIILFSGSSGKKLDPSGIYSSKSVSGKKNFVSPWDHKNYPLHETFNICRTTQDIKPIWKGKKSAILTLADINNSLAHLAGNGYWNDPDMLEVGNGKLTLAQQKAHFALWSIMTAPLMLGNRLAEMTPAERNIVINREAIAINQDTTEQGVKLVVDGRKIKPITNYKNNISGATEIWRKHLKGGEQALLLLNRSDKPRKITVDFSTLGTAKRLTLRDVNEQRELGQFETFYQVEVAANASVFLRASD